MIDDSKLIRYNSYGFIPGPQEEASIFLKRVELARVRESCYDGIGLIKSLFDVYPNWVQVELTNELRLWEAAATYMKHSQGIYIPVICIREKGIPFWCSQEEVVAHELVHATRIAFKEVFFEEVLAYRTSGNWFRRYFGPIFFRPSEVFLFLSMLIGVWVYQLGHLFSSDSASNFILWLPFWIVGLLILRVVVVQSIFSLCLNKLRKLLKQPDMALKLALRLTDREILSFAFKSVCKIRKYILKIRENSLRWHMLNLVYPI